MRPERILVVCTNARPPELRASCQAAGSEAFLEAVRRELVTRGLKGPLRAVSSSCLGACEDGPHCVVYPDNVWYAGVQPVDARDIVVQHLEGGVPVSRIQVAAPRAGDPPAAGGGEGGPC